MLQGRDIVREMAAGREIDPEKLLRLEHVIVAHQRLPEWGAPKPPMTPEALIVHYADDLDAKLNMMVLALADEKGDGAGHVAAEPDGAGVLSRRRGVTSVLVSRVTSPICRTFSPANSPAKNRPSSCFAATYTC